MRVNQAAFRCSKTAESLPSVILADARRAVLLPQCIQAFVLILVCRSRFFGGAILRLRHMSQGAIAVLVRSEAMNVQIPVIADLDATDIAVTA